MNAQMNVISAANHNESKPSPIERLFSRLAAFYGKKFGDLWLGCELKEVKNTWENELRGFSVDEVLIGLEGCKLRDWPPTLPEFLKLCRPPVDFESAFHEAVQQMMARNAGHDRWSKPAIFWAAATIGDFDLRNGSWATLQKRWSKVLQAEIDKGEWPPIPARARALAPPEPTYDDRKAAERILSQIEIKSRGSKDWAHRIINRMAKGEKVPVQAQMMAEETIGKPFEALEVAA